MKGNERNDNHWKPSDWPSVGGSVAGIYRRSVMLVSGRYATLDDGMGFSLMPWRLVIEQRPRQQLVATVRSSEVWWEYET